MDGLLSYKMSDDEKELVLMMVLKRLSRPRWEIRPVRKRRNKRAWKWIDETFGNGCSSDAFSLLCEKGLATVTGDKRYTITQRGKECIKRGYIFLRKDKTAKRANTIAIVAVILATLLNPNFWNILKWIWLKIYVK